jgi:multidrug efflux system membrane fusion protein
LIGVTFRRDGFAQHPVGLLRGEARLANSASVAPRTRIGDLDRKIRGMTIRRAIRFRRLLLAASLTLLGLMPATLAMAQSAPPAGPPAVPVTTDPVRVGPVPIDILANGLAASESVITVRARVDGQIDQVLVQEGQMVKKGQPMFVLDSRLSRALAAQLEANSVRDRAMLTRYRADLLRYQQLGRESVASQQRFEQAEADAASAAAQLKATEALIEQAKTNISYATITAEIDGQLGAIPLKAGNFVRQAENTAITTLTHLDPILVQFSVPERWLPEIRAAMRRGSAQVRVKADGDAGPPITGQVVFVDSAVDSATGTIQLKARFANPDHRLWPGQYVQVVLSPRDEAEAISVPSPALQTGQDSRFVMILKPDGVAERRNVQLVRVTGDRVVVTGNLKAGEKVIVDGAQRVTTGTKAVERAPQPQRVSSVN